VEEAATGYLKVALPSGHDTLLSMAIKKILSKECRQPDRHSNLAVLEMV